MPLRWCGSSCFAGNARLNCSARPRPMTPTQLTVLTSASASDRRMSPWVSSTI